MQVKKLTCTLITPLFACGAYSTEAEFRASEVKGLLRYVYRITSPSQFKKLKEDETILFGGASDSTADNQGHASPIQLFVRNSELFEERRKTNRSQMLLKHKKDKEIACLDKGECYDLIMQLHPTIGKESLEKFPVRVDIEWYFDLAVLSFLLCGMGKRSRKGRGSIAAIGENIFKTSAQVLLWICNILNKIAKTSTEECVEDIYQYKNNRIESTIEAQNYMRPVIQKIEIGKKIKEIDDFLKKVDLQCHNVKCRCEAVSMATGSINPRFASPLIISLIQIDNNYHPVYTYVNSILNKKNMDEQCNNRDAFKKAVESERQYKERW